MYVYTVLMDFFSANIIYGFKVLISRLDQQANIDKNKKYSEFEEICWFIYFLNIESTFYSLYDLNKDTFHGFLGGKHFQYVFNKGHLKYYVSRFITTI